MKEKERYSKKICILSTGGTIASAPTEKGLTPQMTGEQMLAGIPYIHELAQISCKEVMQLDSTNMQPEDWMCIAREIADEVQSCDGIVVLHGTDTMAYTAAALSFMLASIPIPVILTGAQVALGEANTDGIKNIQDAVQVALEGQSGVFLVFAGKIIRGVRAKKMHTRDLCAFESIHEEPMGYIKDHRILWREKHTMSGNPGKKEAEHLLCRRIQKWKPDICLNPKVAVIRLFPGIEEDLLLAVMQAGYKGMILEAFGCGGVPNQRRNLLPVLKKASEQGMLLAIISQCPYDGTDLGVYEVGVEAKKLGIYDAGDMTMEALLAKMMWVLGHTRDREEAENRMKICYVEEFFKDEH